AVVTRQLIIQSEEAANPRVFRVERSTAPIYVADAKHAAGPQEPPHLPERMDWSAQVLHYLVSKNRMERFYGEARLINIADFKAQMICCFRTCERFCRINDSRRRVDADRFGRLHMPRQTQSN